MLAACAAHYTAHAVASRGLLDGHHDTQAAGHLRSQRTSLTSVTAPPLPGTSMGVISQSTRPGGRRKKRLAKGSHFRHTPWVSSPSQPGLASEGSRQG